MNNEPQIIFKTVDQLQRTLFKGDYFASWNTGLNSTERKNVSRVKKILNVLDELNRNNIKNEDVFYFCSQLIKSELSKKYVLRTSGNNYSIKNKLLLKTDLERGIKGEASVDDFTPKAKEGFNKFQSLNANSMALMQKEFKELFLNKINGSKISFFEWVLNQEVQ